MRAHQWLPLKIVAAGALVGTALVASAPPSFALVSLRHVDMNHVPADLAGRFDIVWSACALEHLGSIANGLRFMT